MEIHRLFHHPIPSTQRLPYASASKSDSSTNILVKMKNVTVSYGPSVVLNRINWTVKKGENWMIRGPNGSGKTTLLSMISGNHPQAYSNDISLFGRPRGSGESIWDIKKNIGMVSSECQIQYQKTIPFEDVVMSGFFDSIGLYRKPSHKHRKTAETWMKLFGIDHLIGKYFTMLSQGEQRLGLLARAMVKSPPLLILDEPCQGLDTPNRKTFLRIIDHIGLKTPTVLIYVTHYQDDNLSCITHGLTFSKISHGRYQVKGSRKN
jgi:molybdate transport system ATP-binding protein